MPSAPTTKLLAVRLPDDLHAALNTYIRHERSRAHTKTAVVELALREFLAREQKILTVIEGLDATDSHSLRALSPIFPEADE